MRQFLAAHPESTLPIRVISSPNEEAGSEGFLALFREYAQASSLTLGFEPALDDGSIVTARRGDRWYEIEAQGREAHAGRAHREGINACVALSEKLVALSRLTDYRKDLTVSVGRIEGGQDKYNIVCGSAHAKVDVRFSDLAARDELHRKLEQLFKSSSVRAVSDGRAAQLGFRVVDDCPPLAAAGPVAQKQVEAYRRAIARIEGQPVGAGKSGGAADANYFSLPGAIVIDGLGPRGGKLHTPEEFVSLPSLETRARALAEFLATL